MQRDRRPTGSELRRALGRSARAGAAAIAGLASLGALVVLASPALSAQQPTIHPRHGQPFAPRLGNWEGTTGGFPASFSLRLNDRAGVRRYGFGAVVALLPDRCPTRPSFYSETRIQASRATPLGRRGSLGLTRFGFGGSFVAAGSATMSARYRAGSCAGTLTWHMHPAPRTAVADGAWRLRFADGESASFHVVGGGRIATSIQLPSALTRCNGETGTIDLFVGPSGLAKVSQPGVRASIQFGRHSATGQINAGGKGCSHGPIGLTASLR